jgi:hypothetical protein
VSHAVIITSSTYKKELEQLNKNAASETKQKRESKRRREDGKKGGEKRARNKNGQQKTVCGPKEPKTKSNASA